MPNELKIVIDADVQKAVNGIKQVDKAFSQTASDAQKFGTNISQGTQKATAALAKLPNTSNAATQSLINLGRVVQDAPFGFLGIANNLNPLVESFQRLKQTTGTTGGALKALASSLSGAGGLGFAISAVSSLLIVFGDELLRNKEKADSDSTSLKLLSDEMASVKSNVSGLIDELAFLNQLGSINVKIRGQGDLQDLREQSIAQLQLIHDLAEESERARKIFEKANALVVSTGTDEAIKASAEALNTLREAQAKESEAREKSRLIFRQIELQKIKDAEEAREKAKRELEKRLADFEKFQNETIRKAQQFTKEFGKAFVLPDLEEKFFVTKDQLFKASKKLLSDVSSFVKGDLTALKIKIPVEADFEFETGQKLEAAFEAQQDKLFQEAISSLKTDVIVPINIIPDLSLSKPSLDAIDKKLDLRKQFSVLGDLGLKEFSKIDFTNINKGIEEATKRLTGMMQIATILNQAIGQGLTNAFNSMFDAVLEGKNVFKALANGIKDLIVQTIKAIAQMLILKFVTNLIFPGAGSAVSFGIPKIPGFNNNGFGGIGSSAFSNVIQVNVSGQISNDVIRLSGQRATNSGGRFG